jgi:hypothetical protein
MVKNPKIGKVLNKSYKLVESKKQVDPKNICQKRVRKKSSKSYHLGYNEWVIKSI